METERLDARQESAIDRAVGLLQRGELVAFPTDTVYGVGAPAFAAEAVGRLFTAKIRPANRPIALLVSPEDDLRRIARRDPAGGGGPRPRVLARRPDAHRSARSRGT